MGTELKDVREAIAGIVGELGAAGAAHGGKLFPNGITKVTLEGGVGISGEGLASFKVEVSGPEDEGVCVEPCEGGCGCCGEGDPERASLSVAGGDPGARGVQLREGLWYVQDGSGTTKGYLGVVPGSNNTTEERWYYDSGFFVNTNEMKLVYIDDDFDEAFWANKARNKGWLRVVASCSAPTNNY